MNEALTLVLAYGLGSVLWSWVIYFLRTGRDLRTIGDHNPGSANAIREGSGWLSGHVALLLDTGKGLLAVSLARWFDLEIGWWLAAGYVVIVAHMFPIWLRFRGGRAAATAMGAAGAFLPWQFGITFAAGTLAFVTLRNAQLGILLVAAPLPFIAIAWGLPAPAIAFCFSAPLLPAARAGIDRWRRQSAGVVLGGAESGA